MKGRGIILLMAGAVAAVLATTPRAQGDIFPPPEGPEAELWLSPYAGEYGGETVDVQAGEAEELWIYLDPLVYVFDGNAGTAYHVTDWSLYWEPWSGPGASAELLTVDLTPGQELQVQQWYTFGTVGIDGAVCSTLLLEVSLTFEEEVGGLMAIDPHELHSNAVFEHVVPEPHATALLAGGLLALVRRRRRRAAG